MCYFPISIDNVNAKQILEAFFNNIGVFLDQTQWQQALQSTITAESRLGDRSEAVVKWMMISASAPGIFKTATEVVMGQQYHRKEATLEKLRHLLLRYERWYARWASEFRDPTVVGSNNPERDDDVLLSKLQVFTRYLSYFILTQRFITAVGPDSTLHAESEASRAASQVEQLVGTLRSDSVAKLRISNALRIARSVQETTQHFSSSELGNSSNPPAMIKPQIFSAWCSLLGRPTG